METALTACRICKFSSYDTVVDLGYQVLTSRFPDEEDLKNVPKTRICLVMCQNCKLVQLNHTTNSSELYEHMYGYVSGLNEIMVSHLKNYNQQVQSFIGLETGDWVLDIGSNDTTFINFYPKGVNKVGCDPTGKQFADNYIKNNVQLIPTYFTLDSVTKTIPSSARFKVVSSISMFYDLPDPVQFAKDVYQVMHDDGIWTLEQSYVATMLEKNSIDTICHEHLEYYGVLQIKNIMSQAGFKIINIELNACNGGSFRVYAAKSTSVKFDECSSLLNKFLDQEMSNGIHTVDAYKKFNLNCQKQAENLRVFLQWCKNDGKKVAIYGASTKGNCLLQYAEITTDLIPYATERNPLKYGKVTSTGIPIKSEEFMRNDKPNFLLVLPWHFSDGIKQRESEFLKNGGSLIFPFPEFQIFSHKQNVILTGIHGQIGRYLSPKLEYMYNVFGISNQISLDKQPRQALTIKQDLTAYDNTFIERILTILKPVIVVHLASVTNIEECESNPGSAYKVNSSFVADMCFAIINLKLNCKFFNASSSELYKNHKVYEVMEDDNNFKPGNLYGITKTFSHQLVDYLRLKHSQVFFNGTFFTTESRLRKNSFLLRKVFLHAKDWQKTKTILRLGSLNSYRNISHADDAADAIMTILNQSQGGNFLICNKESHEVEDVVKKIYEIFGIYLINDGNDLKCKNTNEVVVSIGESIRNGSSNIKGYPCKLLNLGWSPKYNLLDILLDLCEQSPS